MKINEIGIAAIVSTLILSTSIKVLSQHNFGNQRSQCEATLTAIDKNTRITLRQGPGTNYPSNGYGFVGDRVYILTVIPPDIDYKKDRQGYGWYRVGFPKSGFSGWIQEDLLRMKCSQIND
ncbi:SH3 domain-containing protein [Aerosakkonemataceae cyanobacterium BLCC-F50]|uniref:SH3 domain-containing protein n=1 Tax=Floridaenema flaviceps BLCC-F50 TaxID=3153642 RepID=A0ABV4XYL5_9CYAN